MIEKLALISGGLASSAAAISIYPYLARACLTYPGLFYFPHLRDESPHGRAAMQCLANHHRLATGTRGEHGAYTRGSTDGALGCILQHEDQFIDVLLAKLPVLAVWFAQQTHLSRGSS